jgi:hypothetical protein
VGGWRKLHNEVILHVASTSHQVLNYHDKNDKVGWICSTYGIGVHTGFRQ